MPKGSGEEEALILENFFFSVLTMKLAEGIPMAYSAVISNICNTLPIQPVFRISNKKVCFVLFFTISANRAHHCQDNLCLLPTHKAENMLNNRVVQATYALKK